MPRIHHRDRIFGIPVSIAMLRPNRRNSPQRNSRQLHSVTTGFDYVKRDVMIPMRDGVKLHTVILVPKGAKHAPILLTRTPYNATALTQPRRQRAPGADPERLRQCHRRDRRGRLHPRRPGRARQVRLRGRLRDEPAAARPAEPDAASTTPPTPTTPSTGW